MRASCHMVEQFIGSLIMPLNSPSRLGTLHLLPPSYKLHSLMFKLFVEGGAGRQVGASNN
jgi:hypothetical protein